MGQEEAFVPMYTYRGLVGALMYIATCTRPDIAHAVGEVAKSCDCYDKSHWTAAKRILEYLKTTQDLSIVFSGINKGELIGFAGANWAGDLDTAFDNRIRFLLERKRDIVEFEASTNGRDLKY
uniref:Polyprotein n=1 Tax=Peronospora matthiolae TaxID=2874970 RepID=A0AAV1U3I9_9STRA